MLILHANIHEEDEAWVSRWRQRSRWRKRLAAAAVLSPFVLAVVWFFAFDPWERSRYGAAESARSEARLAAVREADCGDIVRGVDAEVVGVAWCRSWAVQERREVVFRGLDLPAFARETRRWEGAERDARIHEQPLTRWEDQPVPVEARTVVCGSRPGEDGALEARLCPDLLTEWEYLPVPDPAPEQLEPDAVLFEYTLRSWVDVEDLESCGRDGTPIWPKRPRERDGWRVAAAETYQVSLEDGAGRSFEAEVPLGRWSQLHPGSTVSYMVDGCGQGIGVDP